MEHGGPNKCVTLKRILSVSDAKWEAPSAVSIKDTRERVESWKARAVAGQTGVLWPQPHWDSEKQLSFIHSNIQKGSPTNLNVWLLKKQKQKTPL